MLFLLTFENYYSLQLVLPIIPLQYTWFQLHVNTRIPCCQTELPRRNLSENHHRQRGLWEILPKGLTLSFKIAVPSSFYSAISKKLFLLNEQKSMWNAQWNQLLNT